MALPAPDDGGNWSQARRLGQVVLDGPTADLRAIDFELKAQQNLAGSKAIGTRWATAQARAQEGFNVCRPVGGVVAAGAVGLPGLVAAESGRQVITVELIEATAGKFQFGRGGAGG